MRPTVGITANYDNEERNFFLPESYVRSIRKAGGTAFILPPVTEEEVIDDYIENCDAFVLSGGGDIDPVFWKELPESGLGEINPSRDRFEILLAARILQSNLPVLGICRGCQLLNVAGGGSLIQDISSNLNHYQKAPRDYPFHAIFIEEASRLSAILANSSIKVNSFHHQAVKVTGAGMKAVAWASDGTVEAIEAQEGFALGVQWHPECLRDSHAERIFKALLDAGHKKHK